MRTVLRYYTRRHCWVCKATRREPQLPWGKRLPAGPTHSVRNTATRRAAGSTTCTPVAQRVHSSRTVSRSTGLYRCKHNVILCDSTDHDTDHDTPTRKNPFSRGKAVLAPVVCVQCTLARHADRHPPLHHLRPRLLSAPCTMQSACAQTSGEPCGC